MGLYQTILYQAILYIKPLLAMKPRKSTAITPNELAANLSAC